jgi:hypothetical protein
MLCVLSDQSIIGYLKSDFLRWAIVMIFAILKIYFRV